MNGDIFPKILGESSTPTEISLLDLNSNGEIIFVAKSSSTAIKKYASPGNIVAYLDSLMQYKWIKPGNWIAVIPLLADARI